MEPQHQAASGAAAGLSRPDIEALYLKYRDVMYRVAHKMLRGTEQHRADDVVQEVMVSVMRSAPSDVRNWEAFFVRAVERKVYDLWKSAVHRRERLVLFEVGPVKEDLLGGDEVGGDPAIDVTDELERQQVVSVVRDAVAELEQRDRVAAYVLWQSDGLERTSHDVAEELGVSSSRVRQIVGKARKDLISILESKGVSR